MITEFRHSTLHFNKIGQGSRQLLFFHGFGQDHTAFATVAEALSRDYTLYVFDLYFHGASTWKRDEMPLEKDFWKAVVETFLREQGIRTFSVAGFSLGGKFALATLELFPERTEAIFLVAPDGIATSFWYSLATYPLPFRRVFKSMILHPGRFFSLATTLRSLGVVDKGLLRFAEHQMDTEQKRRRVSYSWIVFRHLRFNLAAVAALVNRFEIALVLVVGKYDKVIRARNMQRLLKHVKTYRLEVLETGHNQLLRAEQLPDLIRSVPPKKIG